MKKMKNNKSNCKSKLFTYIELLMVIVVLGILMAILLPILTRAREYAREELCMANMNQIALGYHSYMHDYDNQYPIVENWLDDFSPVADYVSNMASFKCPSSDTPIPKDKNLNQTTDYLLNGTIEDVERNHNFNNGHGNNPYHFDPSNPSRPTVETMEAKTFDKRIILEKRHSNHFPRRYNLVYIKDRHYELQREGMHRFWTLDDRGWIDTSLDPWPTYDD